MISARCIPLCRPQLQSPRNKSAQTRRSDRAKSLSERINPARGLKTLAALGLWYLFFFLTLNTCGRLMRPAL